MKRQEVHLQDVTVSIKCNTIGLSSLCIATVFVPKVESGELTDVPKVELGEQRVKVTTLDCTMTSNSTSTSSTTGAD